MKAITKNLLPEDKPDGRQNNGGARAGAGRKTGKTKVTATFTIDETILAKAREKYKGKLSSKIEAFLSLIIK